MGSLEIKLPKTIFITGTDGAGKTCLTDWLVRFLEKKDVRVGMVWSRFNNYLSKPLLAFTRLTGHNHYQRIDGTLFGFHDFERLCGLKHLFALLQAVDVNIGTYLNIGRARDRFEVLVCERGPWDTLVDVIADTGIKSLAGSKLGRMFLAQIGQESKTILIRRSIENIVCTRPELIHDRKLPVRMGIYDQLAKTYGWEIVNNDSDLSASQDQISRILAFQSYSR